MSAQPVATFSATNGSAGWARGLLLAAMVLGVAGVVAGVFQIATPAEAVPEGEFDPREALQALIALLQLAVLLGTAVAFLIWFYSAHKNLPALGSTRLEHTPGWAVGGFFVPFLNLVRPVQVMCEVWHCSDPSGVDRDSALDAYSVRKRLTTPPLIGWWWGFFLAYSICGNAAARIELGTTPSPEMLQVGKIFDVVSDLMSIPAAFLAIRLIGCITKWQRERNDRIQQGGANRAASAAAPSPIG